MLLFRIGCSWRKWTPGPHALTSMSVSLLDTSWWARIPKWAEGRARGLPLLAKQRHRPASLARLWSEPTLTCPSEHGAAANETKRLPLMPNKPRPKARAPFVWESMRLAVLLASSPLIQHAQIRDVRQRVCMNYRRGLSDSWHSLAGADGAYWLAMPKGLFKGMTF